MERISVMVLVIACFCVFAALQIKRKYAARSPQAIISGANPISDAGGRVRA
jgi:hypothetical protein